MTPEQINGRIHRARGFQKLDGGFFWKSPEGEYDECPNYCRDLNLIQVAVLRLCNHEALRVRYYQELENLNRGLAISERDDSFWIASSPASDRCHALLRTLGLSEEEA